LLLLFFVVVVGGGGGCFSFLSVVFVVLTCSESRKNRLRISDAEGRLVSFDISLNPSLVLSKEVLETRGRWRES
jgi:hypothetical protein